MQLHTFIADSAAEAVAQIRERLGAEAVVVNVRQVAGNGLSRLWQKSRIEVLAFAPVSESAGELSELRQELANIKQRIKGSEAVEERIDSGLEMVTPSSLATLGDQAKFVETPQSSRLPELISSSGLKPAPWLQNPNTKDRMPLGNLPNWRIGTLLESTGLLPLQAQQVVESLRERHGETPPDTVGQELQLARAVLAEQWRKADSSEAGKDGHLFVGAPGVGKTTCLCQWLTQTTLMNGNSARVWRLDGRSANNAESLSIYAEILGVPVERFVPEALPSPAQLLFIDLPGVNWTDPAALQELAAQANRWHGVQVHLVLNAAYETTSLLAQVRAFEVLPISDLIFTHLDEEMRWGKLWNFVLGTKYSISCLTAGQNVPGDLHRATPERIFARQFPRK